MIFDMASRKTYRRGGLLNLTSDNVTTSVRPTAGLLLSDDNDGHEDFDNELDSADEDESMSSEDEDDMDIEQQAKQLDKKRYVSSWHLAPS